MSTDFAKLIAEIDEADKELSIAVEDERAAERELENARNVRELQQAISTALHRALVLVGGQMPLRKGDTLVVSGAAEADQRAPRERCADEILAAYLSQIPDDWGACSTDLREKWNARTGRSALTLARQTRAKERATGSEPQPADALDIPQSLDRRKAHAQ